MTAQAHHRRIEAIGLWHETLDAQRREVIVALRDHSIIITARPDTTLAHWALEAIERINPGRSPAIYAPGADADERLEIEDTTMIDEIERIRTSIARARPHPGRLRWLLTGAAVLALGGLAVFWLPEAMTRQTAEMVPDATRISIGRTLLADISHLAGPPCTTPAVDRATERLTTRLFDGDGARTRIVISPLTRPATLALPGRIFVASAALAEDYETPEVLAGYILAEDVRRATRDPFLTFLEQAGLRETFRLLTTGDISDNALRDHAIRLLNTTSEPVEDGAMIARFRLAGISTQPYAYARDISGETVLGLIEADPTRGGSATPILSDGNWVTLQEACRAAR